MDNLSELRNLSCTKLLFIVYHLSDGVSISKSQRKVHCVSTTLRRIVLFSWVF